MLKTILAITLFVSSLLQAQQVRSSSALLVRRDSAFQSSLNGYVLNSSTPRLLEFRDVTRVPYGAGIIRYVKLATDTGNVPTIHLLLFSDSTGVAKPAEGDTLKILWGYRDKVIADFDLSAFDLNVGTAGAHTLWVTNTYTTTASGPKNPEIAFKIATRMPEKSATSLWGLLWSPGDTVTYKNKQQFYIELITEDR